MLTGQVASAEEMQFMVEKVMPNFLLVFACLFPLLCVSALLGWLLKLLNDVCARSLVLENLGIRESLQRGWEVSRKNTGYVLINGIVLVVLSFLFGFVAGIPALILWIPFAQAILHGNWSALSILGGVLVALYFLIVAFGIGGILNSFNSTLWTKLYKVLTARAEALATDAQPAEPSSSGD